MKKVTMDVEDFQRVVNYIGSMPVPFHRAKEASEVKDVIEKAIVMEIEEKIKE